MTQMWIVERRDFYAGYANDVISTLKAAWNVLTWTVIQRGRGDSG